MLFILFYGTDICHEKLWVVMYFSEFIIVLLFMLLISTVS